METELQNGSSCTAVSFLEKDRQLKLNITLTRRAQWIRTTKSTAPQRNSSTDVPTTTVEDITHSKAEADARAATFVLLFSALTVVANVWVATLSDVADKEA